MTFLQLPKIRNNFKKNIVNIYYINGGIIYF